MIVGGGFTRYINYLIVIISLQLWPALNAVLNLFIELYTRSAINSKTGGMLTYATFNQYHDTIDKIVAVASGLQWSLPLISLAIARGGMHAFINLASNIGATSMSSAAVSASEVVTGNRNFDNMSLHNLQWAQQTAHKTDFNASYSSGGMSYQHVDGSLEKVTPAGDTILLSGAGQTVSAGSVRFSVDEGRVKQIHEGFSTGKSIVDSNQVAYNEAKSSTLSEVANLVSSIAQRESEGLTHNYESLGEEGKTLQQAVNYTKTLREQNSDSWEQSAQAGVSVSVHGGFSTPSISPLKAGVDVNANASVSVSNSSNQSLSNEEQISKEAYANENLSQLTRAGSNENWMKENSLDTSYSEDIRASVEKMESIGHNLSVSKEMVKRYEKAINEMDNLGASSTQDLYHMVEQRLVNDYNISQQDAHKMIENHDERAFEAWNNIVAEKLGDAGIARDFEKSFDKEYQSKIENVEAQYSDKTAKDYQQNIVNEANKSGISFDATKQNLDMRQKFLAGKFNNMQQNYAAQYAEFDSNKSNKEVIEKELEKYSNEYIKPKIRNGRIDNK